MWSYDSHGAQYDVTIIVTVFVVAIVFVTTTLASDFALSNPSMLMLWLKDPRSRVDTIQLDLLLTVR